MNYFSGHSDQKLVNDHLKTLHVEVEGVQSSWQDTMQQLENHNSYIGLKQRLHDASTSLKEQEQILNNVSSSSTEILQSVIKQIDNLEEAVMKAPISALKETSDYLIQVLIS